MLKTGLTSLLIVMFNLIELVLVSRFFEVKIYGTYVSYLLLISLVGMLGNGLVSQFFLRRHIKYTPTMIYFILFLACAQLLVTVIVFIFSAQYFNVSFISTYILLLTNIFISCFDSVNVVKQRISKINISQILSSFLHLLVLCFFIHFDFDLSVELLVFSLILKNVINCSILFDANMFSLKERNMKRLVSYYVKVVFFYKNFLYSSFYGYLYTNIDRWFVSVFLGPSYLAFYSRAMQIVNIPIVFFNRMLAKDVQSRLILNMSCSKILIIFIFGAILSSISLFFLSETLVNVILGVSWNQLIEPLVILVWIIIPKVLSKYVDVFVRAKCISKDYSRLHLINISCLSIVIFTNFPENLTMIALSVLISNVLASLISFYFFVVRD